MSAFKKCGCGRSYSLLEWGALVSRGDMPSEDETGKYRADMRDCTCGSTIAVEFKQLPDGEWVVNDPAREAGVAQRRLVWSSNAALVDPNLKYASGEGEE